MSRVTEADMEQGAQEDIQRVEQRAVGGVPGMLIEIGGGSPVLGP